MSYRCGRCRRVTKRGRRTGGRGGGYWRGCGSARRELAAARRELARRAREERVVVAASAAADDRRIIHYVLDRRARNMPIPPDGVLHVDEMRENLAPLLYTDSRTQRRGASTST